VAIERSGHWSVAAPFTRHGFARISPSSTAALRIDRAGRYAAPGWVEPGCSVRHEVNQDRQSSEVVLPSDIVPKVGSSQMRRSRSHLSAIDARRSGPRPRIGQALGRKSANATSALTWVTWPIGVPQASPSLTANEGPTIWTPYCSPSCSIAVGSAPPSVSTLICSMYLSNPMPGVIRLTARAVWSK